MLMKPSERNKKIQQMLIQMYDLAIAQPTSNTPCEEEIEHIVAAKEPSYREVLLCIVAHMLIDPKLEASKDWYAFHPRGIYDKGPIKKFLMEHGVPHTKSGPLNITKAANINSAWAERRESPDIANCVIDVVAYLESHNSIPEIQEIGVSLIKKLLKKAEHIQKLSVEVKLNSDPDYISELCIKLIDNVPDSGNTPQQIVSKLLKYYHYSMHSEVQVTGGDDRASATSTTSNKPGDINEEWCNKILKVYEITVKPFDEDRIIDSYDCIEKFNQHSEQKIREVIGCLPSILRWEPLR